MGAFLGVAGYKPVLPIELSENAAPQTFEVSQDLEGLCSRSAPVSVPMLKHRAEGTKPAEAGSGRFSALRPLSLDVYVQAFRR